MGYSTFLQAREFVSAGYGECKPEILGEVVNAVRQHWYNWYQEIALFLDALECFCVQDYCLDCNQCKDTYAGLTLPREMQQVEAMWHNDFPVNLRSEWREWQNGITAECDCRLQKLDMPGNFATFADLLPQRPSRITVSTIDPADAGKRFVIRGIDVSGVPRSEELKLIAGTQGTQWPYRSIDARGGIIKDVTKGRVMIFDEAGRMLGRYEPDETVPAYRRIKITGLPQGCRVVNIRASRRYFPLYGDDDVVESNNRMAFDAMARYLRLYRRTEKDQASLLAEKDHLRTAKEMILGEKSRDHGRSTNTELKVLVPHYVGRGLNRTGRWK